MADSKKYDGGQWEHSLRKLTTATDTLITLPADLYADGNNATVGLVGNMSQTGTPTPQNPIQPQECGDLETSGAKAGQYKIPISSANTTTPVYLGEVETTRKIKKYEVTGQENWTKLSDSGGYARFQLVKGLAGSSTSVSTNDVYVSHYANTGNTAGCCYLFVASDRADLVVYETIDTYATVDDYKAWLAQQYAAGTPVCVWYVLATPTTGIVNEPIRKIGDYADTVSGITIPTITGKDTFDVDTTLKPSEVSLSYTGWHDATVKEWDGSDWN